MPDNLTPPLHADASAIDAAVDSLPALSDEDRQALESLKGVDSDKLGSLLQLLYINSNLLKKDLSQGERNFALALQRLVQDVDERRQAEFRGAEFQKKYGLDNKQMLLLAAVAVASGEVHAEWEVEQIQWDVEHGGPVGSCSCCCP